MLHGGHANWIRALTADEGGVVELDAMTWACLIVYMTPRAFEDASLRRHEYHHCLDFRADPVGFPVKYAAESARVGYAANPYEVAARQAGDNEFAPTADADR